MIFIYFRLDSKKSAKKLEEENTLFQLNFKPRNKFKLNSYNLPENNLIRQTLFFFKSFKQRNPSK